MAGLSEESKEMKKRSFLEKLRISLAMHKESKILKKGQVINAEKKPVNQSKKK
jgi:hypothetical protein